MAEIWDWFNEIGISMMFEIIGWFDISSGTSGEDAGNSTKTAIDNIAAIPTFTFKTSLVLTFHHLILRV
ncbi:MAG: hypothetical protein OES34_06695 [Nitrosopumilus sp.]|nr:hypothetical protein [Nitrosopumilus sp.]